MQWSAKSMANRWYPTMPPSSMSQTHLAGFENRGNFDYLHHYIFAHSAEALEHLTGVSANLDNQMPGVWDLHFYFNNQSPIPVPFRSRGKEVNFMVDGSHGEKICGLDILCSQESDSIGLDIITNKGRRGRFAPARTFGALSLHRLLPPPGTYVCGVFGRVDVKDGEPSSLRAFGLLCSVEEVYTSRGTLPPMDATRRFDDHLNLWSDKSLPLSTYVPGEAFGGQPACGFINWLDFNKPIESITAGLSIIKRDVGGRPLITGLTGLKIDIQDEQSLLLGRYESLGSSIGFKTADKITSVRVGIVTGPGLRALRELVYTTQSGTLKGFRDGDIISDIEESSVTRLFHSTRQLRLAGLVWSFGIGSSSSGDTCLQPLYETRLLDKNEDLNSHDTLYPSLYWQSPSSKPPPVVYLRPVPDMTLKQYDFNSLSIVDRNSFGKFQALDLVAIRIYYNAFLQGFCFDFKNGRSRTLGNTVGQVEVLELGEDERIFTVWFYEQVQPYEIEHGWISGIRVGHSDLPRTNNCFC